MSDNQSVTFHMLPNIITLKEHIELRSDSDEARIVKLLLLQSTEVQCDLKVLQHHGSIFKYRLCYAQKL